MGWVPKSPFPPALAAKPAVCTTLAWTQPAPSHVGPVQMPWNSPPQGPASLMVGWGSPAALLEKLLWPVVDPDGGKSTPRTPGPVGVSAIRTVPMVELRPAVCSSWLQSRRWRLLPLPMENRADVVGDAR